MDGKLQIELEKRNFILSALAALFILPIGAHRAMAQDGYKSLGGSLLPYVIENGDTVFLAPLKAARVYEKKPRKKGREWRKYYRLVYNFAKVYPYAVVARDIVEEVDSTIKTDGLKYVRKDRYVGQVTKELFHHFEKPLKNLTITQGELLMKLVGRECGFTPYSIIREFKNNYAAAFWQGIAKLFGEDLKRPYDPDGEDAATEELVRQWWAGDFVQTYYEIFWEEPPITELPEKYRNALPRVRRLP